MLDSNDVRASSLVIDLTRGEDQDRSRKTDEVNEKGEVRTTKQCTRNSQLSNDLD